VLPKRVGEQRWGVTLGGRSLPLTFASEAEARDTGGAEVVRLDAISLALLRRIRSSLNRKRRWER
jgi:hypothetical protein